MENKEIVARLLAIVKPYRNRAILSFVAMAGTAVTEPALGYALKLLIDKGFGPNKVIFSLWLVPLILLSICRTRDLHLFHRLSEQLDHEPRAQRSAAHGVRPPAAPARGALP
jgi:subfamily B ATP-binding cassette protein MsbA